MFMNNKCSFGLIFVMLAYVTVLGCKAPPPPSPSPPPPSPNPSPSVDSPRIEYRDREVVREVIRETPSEILMPFTITLMRQLQRGDVDIQELQFILFGRISLEREVINPTADLGEGGRASIRVEHIRNSVTINDRLEGALLEAPVETNTGEIILAVCFDEDDNYRLNFSSRVDEPESYFYLNHSPPDRNAPADERGSLVYGGDRYKLRFAGERAPYLLIRISQNEYDKSIPHEASGRRVRKTE
jgi:hypothetical protein